MIAVTVYREEGAADVHRPGEWDAVSETPSGSLSLSRRTKNGTHAATMLYPRGSWVRALIETIIITTLIGCASPIGDLAEQPSSTSAHHRASPEDPDVRPGPCRAMRVDTIAWNAGALEVTGCGFAQLVEVRVYPATLEPASRTVPFVASDDRHVRIYPGEAGPAHGGEVWFIAEKRQIQRFFAWGDR
ncbi:MAG: hypothetical protein EBS48_05150 [Actinobacteria bacterium]|nr:hypothetical protein [Actinomycetota bacterium]